MLVNRPLRPKRHGPPAAGGGGGSSPIDGWVIEGWDDNGAGVPLVSAAPVGHYVADWMIPTGSFNFAGGVYTLVNAIQGSVFFSPNNVAPTYYRLRPPIDDGSQRVQFLPGSGVNQVAVSSSTWLEGDIVNITGMTIT